VEGEEGGQRHRGLSEEGFDGGMAKSPQPSEKENVVNNTRRWLIVSSSGASKGTPLPPPQYVSHMEKLKLGGSSQRAM
jgi:hypothetical protein